MMYQDLSRNEMIEEIKRLTKNLSRRAKSIESLGDSYSQDFVKSFKSTRKQFTGRYANMSDEQLEKLLRNLRYENNLTGSTVEGVKFLKNKFEPIKEKISTLSPKTQHKVIETYNKVMEKAESLLDKYRYELLEIVTNKIYEGENPEEIVQEIHESFTQSMLEGSFDDFELYIAGEID